MNITRRGLLSLSANFGCALGLGGCAGLVQPIRPTCPNDPGISNPDTPLTIDAHAHIFNGSDLQVNAFLSRVRHIEGVGDLLQDFAWSHAPTGNDELARLKQISEILKSCDAVSLAELVGRDQQNQYELGRIQLREAARRLERKRMLLSTGAADLIQQIRALPENYESYKSGAGSKALLRTNLSVEGALRFILRNFQYRYANLFDYLSEYSNGKTRKVDLIIAHLVDYDWPIAGGQETLTSIPDQIRVMEQISILAGGRIHAFAPFDPFKQVAYELGAFRYPPLQMISEAVTNHGFVGVKLYPPMGFRPLSNADPHLPKDFWARNWIPQILRRPDLGQRLDRALASLYEWCRANDVPIMAHTAPTNGPTQEFERLTDPRWWDEALSAFPGLRVNFGHFGEAGDTHGITRAMKFASLMTSARPGEWAYADTGYFVDAVSQPEALTASLRKLLRMTAQKGSSALAQRLMYGSDWEMIIIEGRETESYLKGFERIFATLDKDGSLGSQGLLSDRFFGGNAAHYLGLDRQSPNRDRLAQFYLKSGVGRPDWMAKVDRSSDPAIARN